MMGIKERAFGPLPPVSLDDLVPADHHLEATLDLAFVRDLVRESYAGIGRPSIDPVVFFKLQLARLAKASSTQSSNIDGRSLAIFVRDIDQATDALVRSGTTVLTMRCSALLLPHRFGHRCCCYAYPLRALPHFR